jgi:hypothetical protein
MRFHRILVARLQGEGGRKRLWNSTACAAARRGELPRHGPQIRHILCEALSAQ